MAQDAQEPHGLTYQAAGVDIDRAEQGLSGLLGHGGEMAQAP